MSAWNYDCKGEVSKSKNPRTTARPLQLVRPCECGCDHRDNQDMVGYLHAVTDGEIVNIAIYDEGLFQALARAMGEYTQPQLLRTNKVVVLPKSVEGICWISDDGTVSRTYGENLYTSNKRNPKEHEISKVMFDSIGAYALRMMNIVRDAIFLPRIEAQKRAIRRMKAIGKAYAKQIKDLEAKTQEIHRMDNLLREIRSEVGTYQMDRPARELVEKLFKLTH